MSEKIDLEAIKARAEKATAGPWCWDNRGEKCNDIQVGVACGKNDEDLSGNINNLEIYDVQYVESITQDVNKTANADFIAHARTDVPALMREVERLQTSQARMANALKGVQEHLNGNQAIGEEAAAKLLEEAQADFEAASQWLDKRDGQMAHTIKRQDTEIHAFAQEICSYQKREVTLRAELEAARAEIDYAKANCQESVEEAATLRRVGEEMAKALYRAQFFITAGTPADVECAKQIRNEAKKKL